MKLGKLYTKNIGGNREITIYGSRVMEVFGDNEAGKTSALRGIEIALCGANGIGEMPLRRGAKKGETTVCLVYDENMESFVATEAEKTADLIVTRSFTAKNQYSGGSLTIRGRDGANWQKKKQALLDQIWDATMFSPPDIATRLPGEAAAAFQRRIAATFQELAGREFCDKKATKDADLERLKATRTALGQGLKRYGVIPDLPKAEFIDTAAVMADLARWEKHDALSAVHRGEIVIAEAAAEVAGRIADDAGGRIGAARTELNRAQAKHAELKRTSDEKRNQLVELRAKKTFPPDGLTPKAELQDLVAKAGETNAAAEAYRVAEMERAEKRKIETAHAQVDRDIDRQREGIQELIDGVDLGIPGLTWDSEMVALNEIPWSEISTGQRWKSAIGIVIKQQALKPRARRLRLIMIKEASLIDRKNFREIVEFADSQDWQIAAESIMPHSPDAIEIVDGGIVEEEL